MSVNRENIEKKREEFAGGPEPGWDQMEQAAKEAKKGAPFPEGEGRTDVYKDSHIVEQSGDLTEPVGTESDSY